MSTTATPIGPDPSGFPELTPLGKQLEVLRIGRGISKQHLARFAGTSRQQLWRVMTGKSELTDTLRHRLAEALDVDAVNLAPDVAGTAAPTQSAVLGGNLVLSRLVASVPLETYLATVEHPERTLRTLPNGDAGRELKRTLLNALEDEALRRSIALPNAFFDLRRKVMSGEL